jgi:hypothetical protein
VFEKKIVLESRFILNTSTNNLPNKNVFPQNQPKNLNFSKSAGRGSIIKPSTLSAEAQKLLQKFPGTVTTVHDNE